MRITFSDMHLFNAAPQKHDTTFILNGKEWGVGKTQRERERKGERKRKRKSERQSVGGKSCGT
jgi:hypothetical protein